MKNKIIIYLVFSFTAILFFSCSHKLTDSKKNDKKTTVIEKGFTEGIITSEYKKYGCNYLIKAKVNDKELIYAAINLDESLKHDGKKFQFTFRPIKAQRKGNCKQGIFIYITEFKAL